MTTKLYGEFLRESAPLRLIPDRLLAHTSQRFEERLPVWAYVYAIISLAIRNNRLPPDPLHSARVLPALRTPRSHRRAGPKRATAIVTVIVANIPWTSWWRSETYPRMPPGATLSRSSRATKLQTSRSGRSRTSSYRHRSYRTLSSDLEPPIVHLSRLRNSSLERRHVVLRPHDVAASPAWGPARLNLDRHSRRPSRASVRD